MREEMKNTKKLDNKGFSLIELIIVIAIMAILIGIVGTQVVPYIEKSKQAKDQQVLSSVLTNATTAFASNAESYDSSSTHTFNVGGDCSTATKVSDEFKTLSGFNTDQDFKDKMTSKAGKSISAVTITRDTNGVVTVEVTVDAAYEGIFDVLSST